MELSGEEKKKRADTTGQLGTYFLFAAAIVGVLVVASFLAFLNKTEAIPRSAMMGISLTLVGIGMVGVFGSLGLKMRDNKNTYQISILSSIVALIGIVFTAIVLESPPLKSGWWLAFYAIITVQALALLGIFFYGRKRADYKPIEFARKNALQLGILAVFEIMWMVYIFQAPRTFLSPDIYAAFMSTIPLFGMIALPLTMVIIAGEIDLSFPSIMALGSVAFLETFDLCMEAFTKWGWFASSETTMIGVSVTIALVACLLAGLLAGLMNGLLVVRIGIPSLIATIGTQFFWRGVILVVRQGASGVLVQPKSSYLGKVLVGKVAGYLPMQMIWLLLVAILVWILLNRHKFGAHIYLIGDNENSARLMGVNADRTRILVFALVGVVSALAGITASLHVVNFFTSQGEGYLMTTLASVFLGGTSVFGGTGTILGTFVACFIIGSIEAGIVAIGLTGFWTKLIYGLTIVLSVAMHTILKKRMG
jgi:simple sugar transport system permease protein